MDDVFRWEYIDAGGGTWSFFGIVATNPLFYDGRPELLDALFYDSFVVICREWDIIG